MEEQVFNSEEEEKAFKNSRPGSIVLAVLGVMTGSQIGFLIVGLPRDLEAAGLGEDGAVMAYVNYVLGFAAVALICAFFAWHKRSRIAMGVGLLLIGIKWLEYAMSISAGLSVAGFAVNVVETIFLISALLAAFQYHRLRKEAGGEVDPEVFS